MTKKKPFSTEGLAEHNQRIIEEIRRKTLSSFKQENLTYELNYKAITSELTSRTTYTANTPQVNPNKADMTTIKPSVEQFDKDLTSYINKCLDYRKKPFRTEFMRNYKQYQTIAYQSGYREILNKLLPPANTNSTTAKKAAVIDMGYASDVPVSVVESTLPTAIKEMNTETFATKYPVNNPELLSSVPIGSGEVGTNPRMVSQGSIPRPDIDDALVVSALESKITKLIKQRDELDSNINAIYRTIDLLK